MRANVRISIVVVAAVVLADVGHGADDGAARRPRSEHRRLVGIGLGGANGRQPSGSSRASRRAARSRRPPRRCAGSAPRASGSSTRCSARARGSRSASTPTGSPGRATHHPRRGDPQRQAMLPGRSPRRIYVSGHYDTVARVAAGRVERRRPRDPEGGRPTGPGRQPRPRRQRRRQRDRAGDGAGPGLRPERPRARRHAGLHRVRRGGAGA